MADGHPLLSPVPEHRLTVTGKASQKTSRRKAGGSTDDSSGKAVAGLAKVLGHRFEKPALLTEALTHRSVVSPTGSYRYGYERLEFLGDRVLGLIIADFLLARFPLESEGALARRFNALVQGETLADIAGEIGLGQHVILSPGEEQAGGRTNRGILADICEAVIAALFLDGGLPAAQQFIRRHWAPLIASAAKPRRDAKTTLQEWAQGRALPLPVYSTVSREGPPHSPVFLVRVRVESVGEAEGRGNSKRVAEQAAAEALLLRLEAPEQKP